MQELQDHSPIRWITDRPISEVDFKHVKRGGAPVLNLIPQGFDAYCKILHPIYKYDLSFDFPIPLTKQTSYNDLWQLGKTMSVGGRRIDELAMELRNAQGDGERVRWRELIDELGLTWVPEVNEHSLTFQSGGSWPFYLEAPGEGYYEDDVLDRLLAILSEYTPGGTCYYYFDYMTTDDLEPRLFIGTLGEAKGAFAGVRDYQRPTYWWAADQSWCLCSDYDLSFTLFGGPQAAVDAMLQDQIIEAIEISEATQLGYWADRTNIKATND
jgi:hypothetical protein